MRCYKKAMVRTAITGTLAMVSLAMGLATEASAGCVNPPGFKAGAFQPISWQRTGEFGLGSLLLVADQDESVDRIVGLWKVTYLLPDGNDQTDQRPDLIPGVPLTVPGGGRYGVPLVNAAAFQAPPVDANGNFLRFGNAPNGVFRALNSWQIDLALVKETKLSERVAMEFGVQAFNILNHVQLGDAGSLNLAYDPTVPGTHLSVPGDFGLISTTVNFNNNNDNAASPNTGTGLPRQIQFMLRIKF